MANPFKLVPAWGCQAGRDGVGKHRLEEMAHVQVVPKAVRCRQCGQMIPAGTQAVAFYWNFTEWRRWMFTAYVHETPCASPAPTRAPACQITITYL